MDKSERRTTRPSEPGAQATGSSRAEPRTSPTPETPASNTKYSASTSGTSPTTSHTLPNTSREQAGNAAPRKSLVKRWLRIVGLFPSAHAMEAQASIAADEEPKYRPIDWNITKRILARLAPYKRRYALGVSLGVIMVVLEMQAPQFVSSIIDAATRSAAAPQMNPPAQAAPVTPDRNTGAIDGATCFVTPMKQPPSLPALMDRIPVIRNTKPGAPRIIAIVGLWSIVIGVVILLQRVTILIMTNAGERVQFDLRRDLFAHLQRLSISYYDRTKLGRIISRCTSDLNSLREINVWGIDTIIKNSLMMLVAAGMLLATSPSMFLAVAWLMPVLLICNRVYRHKAGVAHQVMREGFTRVSANLAENITGVRVVTAFSRQVFNLSTFNRLQDANTANAVRLCRISGVYQPLLQFIGLTGKIIILFYGGYLVVHGRVSGVGPIVASFLYWDWFMNPILTFGTFFNQLMAAMAGAERVFDLLDTKPDVEDHPDAKPLTAVNGAVQFDRVTFGYRDDRPVLRDVSFDARPGQMIALVGPTGAGKSSIISLIARFYQPQQGRVLVDGQDIRYVIGESLHRHMGMVQQSSYLFTGTVADNIRHARPEASDDEVMNAARALGSFDIIAALPQGFDTPVGERGAQLSLGQRQLVCFTRAFLANPRILLLDEATSSIDSGTELLIQESLERLRAGRTTFVVAHRLSTIQRADQILVIAQGRIIERGTHAALLAAQGRYAHLYDEFIRATD